MVVPAVVAAVAPLLVESVLTAELSRRASPSPKILPGEILKVALEIQGLSERGLTPILNTDPFTGGLVLSTTDQSAGLFDLLGERFARQALAGTPEESAAIFLAREESFNRTPVTASLVPETPTMREEIVGNLKPITGKLVAPGVVAKRTSSFSVSRRLGGPCAGANTGFSRLTCARGGFS